VDLKSFNQLALSLREKLYRCALRMVGNTDEAEDVVQEAFLRLWLIRSQFDRYHNVSALAMTVTKNLCYDHLKRQKARTVLEATWLQPSQESMEKSFERRQMMDMMKNMIDTLPGLQQMIFKMKDIEGYELEEIAAITGTRVEAVRMNLSRARTKIREQLNKTYNRYDIYE